MSKDALAAQDVASSSSEFVGAVAFKRRAQHLIDAINQDGEAGSLHAMEMNLIPKQSMRSYRDSVVYVGFGGMRITAINAHVRVVLRNKYAGMVEHFHMCDPESGSACVCMCEGCFVTSFVVA